jgi:hypothetical protein
VLTGFAKKGGIGENQWGLLDNTVNPVYMCHGRLVGKTILPSSKIRYIVNHVNWLWIFFNRTPNREVIGTLFEIDLLEIDLC